MGAGEAPDEGNERIGKKGTCRGDNRKDGTQNLHPQKRTGRRPAKTPDGEDAYEELIGFIARFCKVLNPVFSRIENLRDPKKCLYDGRTFLWTFILGFFVRMGSRNAMDARRCDENFSDAVHKLSQQDWWIDNEKRTTPCSLSVCNYLEKGCTAVLEQSLVEMMSYMIRLKLFDYARLRGLFVIAVDATKHEKIRCCKWKGNRANRYVLEAKLITPWGNAYSLMSVPLKPWHEGDEKEKQDSEYHGFLRLAPKLKEAFPHLGICILGDGLYACTPLMKLCDSYHWKYIFTFKEGRTPKAYAEAQELMKLNPSDSGDLVRHDKRGKRIVCGTVSWAKGVEISRGTKEGYSFNVVKVDENDNNGSAYNGQFATSFEIEDVKQADAIGMWGRRRWGIESSFHVEKHGGYNLEHNFCNNSRVSRNIYLLMQIAHNLWQLFNRGCLLPLQKHEKYRNMTHIKWVELLYFMILKKGIPLAIDEMPQRYVSREFLRL